MKAHSLDRWRPFRPGNRILDPLTPDESRRTIEAMRQMLRTSETTVRLGATVLSIEALRMSKKSQVVLVSLVDGRQIVAKRHGFQLNFDRELFALELMGSSGYVPNVIFSDRQSRLLLMDYVSSSIVQVDQPKDVYPISALLGRIHRTALAARMALNAFTGNEMVRPPTDASLGALRETYGGDAWWVSVGDIKLGHFLWKESTAIAVDMETFQFGLPPEMDLIALANLAPDYAAHPSFWKASFDGYEEGFCAPGFSISQEQLVPHALLVAKHFAAHWFVEANRY